MQGYRQAPSFVGVQPPQRFQRPWDEEGSEATPSRRSRGTASSKDAPSSARPPLYSSIKSRKASEMESSSTRTRDQAFKVPAPPACGQTTATQSHLDRWLQHIDPVVPMDGILPSTAGGRPPLSPTSPGLCAGATSSPMALHRTQSDASLNSAASAASRMTMDTSSSSSLASGSPKSILRPPSSTRSTSSSYSNSVRWGDGRKGEAVGKGLVKVHRYQAAVGQVDVVRQTSPKRPSPVRSHPLV